MTSRTANRFTALTIRSDTAGISIEWPGRDPSQVAPAHRATPRRNPPGSANWDGGTPRPRITSRARATRAGGCAHPPRGGVVPVARAHPRVVRQLGEDAVLDVVEQAGEVLRRGGAADAGEDEVTRATAAGLSARVELCLGGARQVHSGGGVAARVMALGARMALPTRGLIRNACPRRSRDRPGRMRPSLSPRSPVSPKALSACAPGSRCVRALAVRRVVERVDHACASREALRRT